MSNFDPFDNTNRIAESLELVPLVPTKKDLVAVKKETEYATAKENMEGIIELGTSALSELAGLASMSQDPRAYRVLTELLTAMVTANKELVAIKQMKVDTDAKEAANNPAPVGGPQTVHNNMFVGSTAELAEVLEKMRK